MRGPPARPRGQGEGLSGRRSLVPCPAAPGRRRAHQPSARTAAGYRTLAPGQPRPPASPSAKDRAAAGGGPGREQKTGGGRWGLESTPWVAEEPCTRFPHGDPTGARGDFNNFLKAFAWLPSNRGSPTAAASGDAPLAQPRRRPSKDEAAVHGRMTGLPSPAAAPRPPAAVPAWPGRAARPAGDVVRGQPGRK